MKKIIALALLATATPAYAWTYYLVNQWMNGASRMCQYGNGEVYSVGMNLCPLYIDR